MTFGSIWLDALAGLAVATLFGAFLDARKQRWRGRRSPPSPYATPGYKGNLRRRGGPEAP